MPPEPSLLPSRSAACDLSGSLTLHARSLRVDLCRASAARHFALSAGFLPGHPDAAGPFNRTCRVRLSCFGRSGVLFRPGPGGWCLHLVLRFPVLLRFCCRVFPSFSLRLRFLGGLGGCRRRGRHGFFVVIVLRALWGVLAQVAFPRLRVFTGRVDPGRPSMACWSTPSRFVLGGVAVAVSAASATFLKSGWGGPAAVGLKPPDALPQATRRRGAPGEVGSRLGAVAREREIR